MARTPSVTAMMLLDTQPNNAFVFHRLKVQCCEYDWGTTAISGSCRRSIVFLRSPSLVTWAWSVGREEREWCRR